MVVETLTAGERAYSHAIGKETIVKLKVGDPLCPCIETHPRLIIGLFQRILENFVWYLWHVQKFHG